MLGDLGGPELLIIGALLFVLFGAGKLTKLGGELGASVREFRDALRSSQQPEPVLIPVRVESDPEPTVRPRTF